MENFSGQFKSRGEMSTIVRMKPIMRGFRKEGCSAGNWRFCLGREGWQHSAEEDKENKIKKIEKRTQADDRKGAILSEACVCISKL